MAFPDDEPRGSWLSANPATACPYKALQPFEQSAERAIPHSLKFALPRMIAPAASRRLIIVEGLRYLAPTSAYDPAVRWSVKFMSPPVPKEHQSSQTCSIHLVHCHEVIFDQNRDSVVRG